MGAALEFKVWVLCGFGRRDDNHGDRHRVGKKVNSQLVIVVAVVVASDV